MEKSKLRDQAIEALRKWGLDLLLKKMLVGVAGWKVTIVKHLFNWYFKAAVKPFLKRLYRKGKVKLRKGEVAIVVDRIEGAKDETEFNSAVDDLFK